MKVAGSGWSWIMLASVWIWVRHALPTWSCTSGYLVEATMALAMSFSAHSPIALSGLPLSPALTVASGAGCTGPIFGSIGGRGALGGPARPEPIFGSSNVPACAVVG